MKGCSSITRRLRIESQSMLRVFGKLGQGMEVGESVAVTLESSKGRAGW